MSWSRLARIARSQYGAIHLRQARSCGIASSTLLERARREGWPQPFPGTLVFPGVPERKLTRLSALLLSFGPPVAATRWTAAYLHGLRPQLPRLLQIVVPHTRRARRYPFVEVLRSRTLLPEHDVVTLRALPAANVPRMLLDLTSCSDQHTMRSTVIDARQRGLLDLGQAVERLSHVGRGLSRRRQLAVVLWEQDSERCDSVFEHSVRRRLEAAGFLLAPEPVVVVGPRRVLHLDIGILPWRVAVECDGFGAHSSRGQLDLDTRRGNQIRLAERPWLVLHLSWDRFVGDWDGFLEEVRTACERQWQRGTGPRPDWVASRGRVAR